MKRLPIFLFTVASLVGATRDYSAACSAVFPAATGAMTAAHFEPKVSDATGGVLTLAYIGDPMVFNFMVKHANPFLEKYVENGEKLRNKFRGLSYASANFTFAPSGDGCRVNLTVGLVGLDTAPGNRDASGKFGAWQQTAKPLTSNGAAEIEFLDAIAKTVR